MTPRRTPERVLMTADAVGGVWRWSVDAARALAGKDVSVVIAGLGPRPSAEQEAEVAGIRGAELVWLDQPLEWLAASETDLRGVPGALASLARERGAELIHVNAPAQAAGLETDLPVAAQSHSCVITWWRAMRDEPVPPEWEWQRERNLRGMEAADLVLAPSASHAAAVKAAHTISTPVATVLNASAPAAAGGRRAQRVLAAARWWDDAKNGAALDAAAAAIEAPVLMAGAVESPVGARFKARHAHAPGPLPAVEVLRLMSVSAVFVSPSIYEPFGLSTLEAAGAGTALVLSDIPTYRELWDGVALFRDPHDPGSIADAANRLLADGKLRRRLGLAARRRRAGFSPDVRRAGFSPRGAGRWARTRRRRPPPISPPPLRGDMNFVFYTHSLVSCWNHGNAHFQRGVIRELIAQGHRVTALEPADGWSRENLVAGQGKGALDGFARAFPELERVSRSYGGDFDHEAALEGADVVIVHEWTDPALVARARARCAGRARGSRWSSTTPTIAPSRRTRTSPGWRWRTTTSSSASGEPSRSGISPRAGAGTSTPGTRRRTPACSARTRRWSGSATGLDRQLGRRRAGGGACGVPGRAGKGAGSRRAVHGVRYPDEALARLARRSWISGAGCRTSLRPRLSRVIG